ncbi:MAG: membrane protein insertion efficiency factor YidD [Candidatus Omnitrophica bacterium]|nr:membrane protein insertion efficiency factor YidD [Candidatus Omnitrophota bacterium]
MKKLAINTINFYRKYLSILRLPSCRFYPTCSQYAAEAIEKKGFFKGSFLTLSRLLKCHPFCRGGYDPVR